MSLCGNKKKTFGERKKGYPKPTPSSIIFFLKKKHKVSPQKRILKTVFNKFEEFFFSRKRKWTQMWN